MPYEQQLITSMDCTAAADSQLTGSILFRTIQISSTKLITYTLANKLNFVNGCVGV